MSAALCRAVNDWIAAEWLDRDPRLRASMVVPTQNPDLAVAEIERLAADHRFVQVLLLAMGDVPLGAPHLADLRGGRSGTACRSASMPAAPIGTRRPARLAVVSLEDYVAQVAGVREPDRSASYAEGVFAKFPDLKVVLIESGFTWLPTLLWRSSKILARHADGDAVDRPAAGRHRARPCPPDLAADRCAGRPAKLSAPLEHIGSDRVLLFSTDYPHWQFDGEDVLPEGLSAATLRRMLIDNPLATYPRLRDAAGAGKSSARARRRCHEHSGS